MILAGSQLIVLIVLSRSLSPTQLGVAVLFLASGTLTGTLRFAISLTVGREVARGLPNSRPIAEAYGLAAVAGACTLVAGLGIAAALAANSQPAEAATLVACTVAIAVDIATLPFAGVLVGTGSYGAIGRAAAFQGVAAVLSTAALAPTVGLFAVGVAQIAKVAAGTVIVIPIARAQLARYRLRFAVSRPSSQYLRADVGPLLVLSSLSQIAIVLDLFIVSGIVSTAAAGSYRIGWVVPSSIATLIFLAWDTAFARLAAATHEARLRLGRTLFRAFGVCGIAVLAATMVSAKPIVVLIEGHRDPTAEIVVALFAGYWSAIVTVHGMALLLMADGQQRGIMRLMIVQVTVQVLASVALAITIGSTGPALATTIVAGFSNLFVFPRLAGRLHTDVQGTVAPRMAALSFAAGASIGAVTLFAVRPGDSQLLSIVTIALTAAALALGMFAYARRRGLIQFLRSPP